ncbi:MAG: hypothetical protein A2V66_13750, partial [Ignavibacteria bacterium RBG_13_36_8]
MARSIPAVINKDMLSWVRKHAGYDTIEEAALKTKLTVAKLLAWESGDKQPSIRQVEKLAKDYHCSYSMFSLKQPPEVTPLAKEYRRLPGVKPGSESPELRIALRDMIYRRRVALNLMNELGESWNEFSFSAKLNENPEELALRIRSFLGITNQIQFSWKNNSDAWKDWRNAIESVGVLVLLFSDVEPEEVRGVSLFHTLLPVIGINNHEISASRPFTLIHEFVHILLANGLEEKPAIDEKRPENEWNKVERFAEQVTGAVLIPKEAVANEQLISCRQSSSEWSISEVWKLARRYKVTPSAFATRLLVLNLVTPTAYRKWKDSWG